MANQNNNQWPKAFTAILGTASISAAAYYMHNPKVMLSMFALIIILSFFD